MFSLSSVAAFVVVILGVNCQFVTTNGVNFELNGSPFSYAGTNVYDTGFRDAQYAQDVVNAVQAAGYRVLRTWAFNEYDTSSDYAPPVYYQSWANGVPTINTGANGLELLDSVVEAAEAANIKLILTLANNWQDYGGMDVYVNQTLGYGQPHDLFYSNQQINQYYMNYVNAVVSRYQNSSAIFAWELANESRCSGTGSNPQSSSCTPDVITGWANTMSSYVKSIDPNHLVSFGGEGFFNRPGSGYEYEYDGGSGQDYDALIALPHIDFGTMHLYISSTSGYENTTWAMQWLSDHEDSSATANKPCIQEEYGINRSDTTYSRTTVYDQWHQYILSSKSINGDMTWGSLIVDGDCPGYDVYAICSSDSDYADLVTNWAGSMNGKV